MAELDDYGMPIVPNVPLGPTRPEPGVPAEQGQNKRPKFRGLAKAIEDYTGGDPEKIQELIDEVEKAADKVIERGSPLTRKLVQHTKDAYEEAVNFLSQGSVKDPWTYQAVKDYATRFIELRARVAKGKTGGRVKAETVLGWYSCILVCIVGYTYDPETGFKVGGKLLYKEDLARNLLDHVKEVTKELNLDRHSSKNKKSCGLPEARIMIEYLVRSSPTRGRLRSLQLICVVIICLACGIRPSSLCAGCQEDIDAEKFMIMGDFKLYNRGQFAIDIDMNVDNLKGYNSTVVGRRMNIWLRALSKGHNMIFDTFWIVIYIWARGCLAGYPTIHDLLTTQDAELVITSPNEPFLLAPNRGATKLDNKPWNANGLGRAMSGLAKSCNLHGVTMYSYRRGFANTMSVTRGREETSMAMGHKDGQSVLTVNYSHGAGNIDLLGIMTGEAADQYRPGAESALQMRVRVGVAVMMLSKAIAQSSTINDNLDEDNPDTAADGGDVDVHKADGELEKLDTKISDAWSKYMDSLDRGSALYRAVDPYKKTNVGILKNIKGHKLYLKAAKKPEFVKRMEPVEKELREACEKYRKRTQFLRKKGKIEAEKELEKNKATTNKPSVENTDTALRHVQTSSTLVSEAVKQAPNPHRSNATAGASNAAGPSNVAGPSKSNVSEPTQALDEAHQAIEKLSRDEEEDEDEVRESYRELRRFKQNNLMGAAHLQDVEEAADAPEPPPEGEWKDQDEQEQIPMASTYDIRVFLTRMVLDPILFEREMRAQIEADGGKILCQKCRIYVGEDEEPHNYASLSNLMRHIREKHTEWSELVPQMECGDSFKCPGVCGADQQFDSIEEVYDHCLSDDCPDHEAFRMMHAEHEAQHTKRYEEQSRYRQEGGSASHRMYHHGLYLNYLRALTEDDLLELADEYEIPREEVQPHVGLMLENLHFIATEE
ncbi:unnamed protein product [Rhizoctonia solani]|uniref:Uncharacterized protein n=1 Tax=Rhizoctonia solani TaxID=456999 RepID=A0A8H3EA15_9AGAM|nr:unnamed protein product [Rhizoctonia solani]